MKLVFLLVGVLVCLAIHTTIIQASGENGSSGESCDTSGSKECNSPEWDDDKDDDPEETCEGDKRRCVRDDDVEKVKNKDKKEWIKQTVKDFNKSCGKKGTGRRAFKNAGKYVRSMRKRRAPGGYKTGRKNRRRLWVNIKGLRKHFSRACADFNMTINYIVHCENGGKSGVSSTTDCGCTNGSTTESSGSSSLAQSSTEPGLSSAAQVSSSSETSASSSAESTTNSPGFSSNALTDVTTSGLGVTTPGIDVTTPGIGLSSNSLTDSTSQGSSSVSTGSPDTSAFESSTQSVGVSSAAQSDSSTQSGGVSSAAQIDSTTQSSGVSSAAQSDSTTQSGVSSDATTESSVGSTTVSYEYGEGEQPAPEVEECDCDNLHTVIREVIIRRCNYLQNYTRNIDLRDMEEFNEASIKIIMSYVDLSASIMISYAQLIQEGSDFSIIKFVFTIFTSQISFCADQFTQATSTCYTEPSLMDNSTLSIVERQEEVEGGLRGEPEMCSENSTSGVELVISIMRVNIVQASIMCRRLIDSSVVQKEQTFLNTCESNANSSRDAVHSECDAVNATILGGLDDYCKNNTNAKLLYGPYVCDQTAGGYRSQHETYFKMADGYLRIQVEAACGTLIFTLKVADAFWQFVLIFFDVSVYINQVMTKMYVLDGGATNSVPEGCTACASDFVLETRKARIETYDACTECAKNNINSTIEVGAIECLQPIKKGYKKCIDDLKNAPLCTYEVFYNFYMCFNGQNQKYSYGGLCGNSFVEGCNRAADKTQKCKQPKIEEGGSKAKQAREKCSSCRKNSCASE